MIEETAIDRGGGTHIGKQEGLRGEIVCLFVIMTEMTGR